MTNDYLTKVKTVPYLCLLIFLTSCTSPTGFQVTKIGDTVIDFEALTIDGQYGQSINGQAYQQDILASHLGFQYVAYYDANRHVCLGKRKLPDGDWEILKLTDYTFATDNAHNTISMGLCPGDGTLHLAFDHHNDSLHYRVSRRDVVSSPEDVKWDSSLFGPVVSELGQERPVGLTYPRFHQTPEGALQIHYRHGGFGNGDRMFIDYDPVDALWKNARLVDSREGRYEDEIGVSDNRSSYPNDYNYGPQGKLHATWVWRENGEAANHDLMYAYSEDNGKTWKNNDGEQITGPPRVDTPGITVVNIGRTMGLMNTNGQVIDSQGRVHVVAWHSTEETLSNAGSRPGESIWGPPEARRYFHYWRDTDGTWQHFEIPWIAGNRPKLFVDREDNLYMIFGIPQKPGPMDHDIFFTEGNLVFAGATADSRWMDWRIIHTEEGPFLNEMLYDRYRWEKEGILSVIVQESPANAGEPTHLHVVDIRLEYN